MGAVMRSSEGGVEIECFDLYDGCEVTDGRRGGSLDVADAVPVPLVPGRYGSTEAMVRSCSSSSREMAIQVVSRQRWMLGSRGPERRPRLRRQPLHEITAAEVAGNQPAFPVVTTAARMGSSSASLQYNAAGRRLKLTDERCRSRAWSMQREAEVSAEQCPSGDTTNSAADSGS